MTDPAPVGTSSWQESLAGRLNGLGRWIESRYLVAPRPGDEPVPAARYLDPEFLRAEIARAATAGGRFRPAAADRPPDPEIAAEEPDDTSIDLRIAVSRFSRHYCASVSCVAFGGLAAGVGIDVSLDRCLVITRAGIPFHLCLRDGTTGTLRCAERPAALPVGGEAVETLDELRRYVWRKLYSENIAPVFERIHDIIGVSPRLLWANAAEWTGMVPDAAEEYLGGSAAEPYIADRDALLRQESLPGPADPNPLRGQLEWIPYDDGLGFPRSVMTRKMCCITYYLEDRAGRLCQNCPYLPVDDRVALVRARHGIPMGVPAGPAEKRAMELGTQRLAGRK